MSPLPWRALVAAISAVPALAQGPLPTPVAPPENPTTAEKAVLGKMLFWEEQLSSDGTVACGTCHVPGSGGVDPRLSPVAAHPGPDGLIGTQDDVFGSPGIAASNAFGHFVRDDTFGLEPRTTGRQTPTMIGAAHFTELFWDGRAGSRFVDPLTGVTSIQAGGALEAQSLEPIVNDVEMAYPGRGWAAVVERLEGARPMALASDLPPDVIAALFLVGETYPAQFQEAFGTPEITPERIAFALAAYQRTLNPDQSKFDRVMRGQAQFTQAEQRGRGAFNSPQSRCVQCHSGTLFSDRQFHNLGLRPIGEDRGRQDVTGSPQDAGRFKTPSLRNVMLRERFFHTGAPGINGMNQLLGFYDQDGGPFPQNKDPRLNGLMVPPFVRNDIIAFLNTLTDPRVAAETAPFDRPTLRSERAIPGPEPLGFGGVAGASGLVPELILDSPSVVGQTGFRIGVTGGNGGAVGAMIGRLTSDPSTAPLAEIRGAFRQVVIMQGSGIGAGYATWSGKALTSPAMAGVTLEVQWRLRDFGVPGGAALSHWARIVVE